MKTYIKKGFLYLALGFVVIFCLRLGYGYFVPTEPFSPTSGREASELPGAVRLPLIAQPIVQAARAGFPKLNTLGLHYVTAPMRWAFDDPIAIELLQLR